MARFARLIFSFLRATQKRASPAKTAGFPDDLDPDGLAVASKTVEIIPSNTVQTGTVHLPITSPLLRDSISLCEIATCCVIIYTSPTKVDLSHCRRHYHQGLTLVVYISKAYCGHLQRSTSSRSTLDKGQSYTIIQ
jgi:hypothetical protein